LPWAGDTALTKANSGVRIQTMSKETLPLLIMTGTSEGSDAERMVSWARQAVTLDLVERALTVPSLRPIVVATNSTDLAQRLADVPVRVELDMPGEPFHFGRRLAGLIARHGMDRCFYIGGGAGPLLAASDMAGIAEKMLSAHRLLITNNFYSSDFAAFGPTSALEGHRLPDNDNELAWLLGEDIGLPIRELPRNGATQFDVDTPTDLLVLAVHPEVGSNTRACLDEMELNTESLEAALPLMLDRDAEILVAGRVSSATWSYMERETACRTRVLSEERGMRASGRQARNEVRSVLGYYLDVVGLERFFETLATMGQAVFLDNRVIFAHRGLWPSASDRFFSDLRRPAQVRDPFVRALTEAAMIAPVPVIMGGHSLVAGGMYVLIEAAWARGHDVPRHVVPEAF
jgi:CTP:molybdopterin cytidylyltransferase MocA